jgi:hypothetical protein
MKTTLYAINENGLTQIHQFLSTHHKKGGDHFDLEMVRAWAKDAEFQLDDGNGPSIEIRSWDTVSGHAQEFTISPDGISCQEVEVE